MMWHATILGVPLLGRDYCNHGYHSLLRCCNRGHFIDKVHQSDYRTITTHCIYPTPRRQISLTQAVICHPAAISSLLLPRFAIICFSPTSEEGEATSYTFSKWNQNDVLMDYRMMMMFSQYSQATLPAELSTHHAYHVINQSPTAGEATKS